MCLINRYFTYTNKGCYYVYDTAIFCTKTYLFSWSLLICLFEMGSLLQCVNLRVWCPFCSQKRTSWNGWHFIFCCCCKMLCIYCNFCLCGSSQKTRLQCIEHPRCLIFIRIIRSMNSQTYGWVTEYCQCCSVLSLLHDKCRPSQTSLILVHELKSLSLRVKSLALKAISLLFISLLFWCDKWCIKLQQSKVMHLPQ